MTREEIWQVIEATLEELPDEMRRRLEYTIITVDEGPPGDLLGLYEGAPETVYASPHTDTITLFKATLEREAASPDELRQLVRETLLHEIGHHFGLGEHEVRAARYPKEGGTPS